MIEFTCDCGNTVRAEDVERGNNIVCPTCGKRQSVPSGKDRVTAEPSPGRRDYYEQEQSRRRRFEEDEEAEPVTSTGTGTSGKAIVSLVLGLLGFFLSILAGLPALIVGFMALGDISSSRGRLKGRGLAYTGIILGIVTSVGTLIIAPLALLFPAVWKIRQAAERMQSMNNMKEMTLAMHNYHSDYDQFPLAYTLIDAPPGRPQPGMSWRVAILPYFGEDLLYKQYNPQQPWDGPINRQIQSTQVRVYQFAKDPPSNQTYFQVFVTDPGKTPHSMFIHPTDAKNKVRLDDVTDGQANTILIAESPAPVPWASPQDMPFDPGGPVPSLGSHSSQGAVVGLADGSVRTLAPSLSPAMLKALITRDGGEIVNPNW